MLIAYKACELSVDILLLDYTVNWKAIIIPFHITISVQFYTQDSMQIMFSGFRKNTALGTLIKTSIPTHKHIYPINFPISQINGTINKHTLN